MRLASAFILASVSDGDDRILNFASGVTARERLVGVDDQAQRLCYTILEQRFAHHSASMQLFPEGAATRFVWITDLLPADYVDYMSGQMDVGIADLKQTIERGSHSFHAVRPNAGHGA